MLEIVKWPTSNSLDISEYFSHIFKLKMKFAFSSIVNFFRLHILQEFNISTQNTIIKYKIRKIFLIFKRILAFCFDYF